MSNLVYGFSFAVIATIIGSFGALFFKYASKRITPSLLGLIKNYYLLIGFFLYGISSLIYVYALTFADLSTLYPVAGLSYVWISLLSIKFLKEQMNDLKWFGILMILLGVFLVSFST